MKRTLTILTLLLTFAYSASAQKWSVSTNIMDYVSLGTINAEGSVATGRHLTVNASARVNPWTFFKGDNDRQMQNRHQTYAAGVRYWPWHIYSGWWFGAAGQYQEYNRGGIISQKTEEGDAFGLSLSAGYTLMLHKWVNLEFGAGVWGGQKAYTTFACPKCGKIEDSGRKWFVMPNDLIVALVFIF